MRLHAQKGLRRCESVGHGLEDLGTQLCLRLPFGLGILNFSSGFDGSWLGLGVLMSPFGASDCHVSPNMYTPQRTQYALVKESTLTYRGHHVMIYIRYFP